MPHIVVEYSENLSKIDTYMLMADLHDALAAQDTVKKAKIKTRAIPIKDCMVGETEDMDEMVHIVLKLLKGRDVALRKKMADALFGVACSAVRSQYTNCSVTVEVVEMEPETYIG